MTSNWTSASDSHWIHVTSLGDEQLLRNQCQLGGCTKAVHPPRRLCGRSQLRPGWKSWFHIQLRISAYWTLAVDGRAQLLKASWNKAFLINELSQQKNLLGWHLVLLHVCLQEWLGTLKALLCIWWFDQVWPSSYFKTQRLTLLLRNVRYLLVQLPRSITSQKSTKFVSVGRSNDGTDVEIEVVRAWQQQVVFGGFLDCFLYLPPPPLPSPASRVELL